MSRFYSHLKQINAWRRHTRSRLKWGLRQQVASLRRKLLDRHITFIGITGSAGKTTTVDLAAAALSAQGLCQKTKTFNSELAIIRAILDTGRRHRYCVAELAASGPGTLDIPIRVFRPEIAVITVIGRDHISAYADIEGIAAEKGKVVSALPADGTAVLNIDDPLVRAIGERCGRKVIWFGEAEGSTLRLVEARSRWPEPLSLSVAYEGTVYEVPTHLHGRHMALSVIAALGTALAAGVPLDAAIRAIASVLPSEGRMEAVDGGGGVTFIRDDWKSPGWSFTIPLEFLREAQATRKVAVIGTVSDTTGDSSKNYKRFCRQVREVADLVVFVGPHAHRAVRARQKEDDASIHGFSSIRQAVAFLDQQLREGDLVLLKGSNRADHLCRILLNRKQPVRCWRERCEKVIFCNACHQLLTPSGDTGFDPSTALLQGKPVTVLVGLGNPGEAFRNTAHNVGYRVLDALVLASGGSWADEPEGLVSRLDVAGETVMLLKPGAFINQSGPLVKRFLERVGGLPKSCTLIHDDADLALGEVRLKRDGGDAGHKGVRSVISALETVTFPRVRLGVRLSGDKRKTEQFVVAEFSAAEEAVCALMIETAAAQIHASLKRQSDGTADA
jgi:UDP-N-acetylmuramoyl-tripeptide--D-alanyl-D-alanine ligase